MVFKKKRPVQQAQEEPEEEEFEEEEEEDDEGELPPLPAVKKAKPKTISSPTRGEIEDMIEGHLLRATDLLRLLRSAK